MRLVRFFEYHAEKSSGILRFCSVLSITLTGEFDAVAPADAPLSSRGGFFSSFPLVVLDAII